MKIPKYKIPVKNLALSKHKTFGAKLNATIEYLRIEEIHFIIAERRVFNPLKSRNIPAKSMIIHGTTYSHLRSLLLDAFNRLKKALEEYILSNEDYLSISKRLIHFRSICLNEFDSYDMNNIYKFNSSPKLTLVYKDQPVPVTLFHISLSSVQEAEFTNSNVIRRYFFRELANLIDSKIQWHLSLPLLEDKPYAWNSKNAELEVAELLYALFLNGLIRIDIKGEGSEAKFRKKFFELFGISDRLYNQKVQQIRNRVVPGTYLSKLVLAVNDQSKRRKNKPR